ncbi:MAG: TolC family protein, partial [Wenzhouxiangellaceae bacterium]
TEAIENWRARLTELSQAVAERVEAGDASRFDHLRIEREKTLLDGRLAARRAELASARERLFGFLESRPRPLAGRLLPGEPPTAATVMAALHEHPEIAGLHAGAESDQLAARAAAREAWPEVTLGVGIKELEEGPISETGGMFSVALEIPLFKRGRQRRAAAEAGAGAKSAKAALATARLESEARAVLDELAARRAAALAMRAELDGDTNSLPELAEAAYRAGELGVMSLIDAWQTELELRLQAIELEYAARVAAIELMQLTGETK